MQDNLENISGTGGETFGSITLDRTRITNQNGSGTTRAAHSNKRELRGRSQDPMHVYQSATRLTENVRHDLDFEEDDPLIHKNSRTILLDKQNQSTNMAASSCNPESESQLSLRHLSEGGKAMRTTDPVPS